MHTCNVSCMYRVIAIDKSHELRTCLYIFTCNWITSRICFVPPDFQQVTHQPASPSPISARERIRILLHVTHLVMVVERKHRDTMGGGGVGTLCIFILYIDRYIIVTNGSITGLLRQPDQVSKNCTRSRGS